MSQSPNHEHYSADAIVVKVAIEFCLNIQAVGFLFSDIYHMFKENNMAMKFVQNLEPFILNGQFRNQPIPEAIIRMIIKYYEDQKKLKLLEKIIQQLDFGKYTNKDELIVTC